MGKVEIFYNQPHRADVGPSQQPNIENTICMSNAWILYKACLPLQFDYITAGARRADLDVLTSAAGQALVVRLQELPIERIGRSMS
jgi:hypothetical protein